MKLRRTLLPLQWEYPIARKLAKNEADCSRDVVVLAKQEAAWHDATRLRPPAPLTEHSRRSLLCFTSARVPQIHSKVLLSPDLTIVLAGRHPMSSIMRLNSCPVALACRNPSTVRPLALSIPLSIADTILPSTFGLLCPSGTDRALSPRHRWVRLFRCTGWQCISAFSTRLARLRAKSQMLVQKGTPAHIQQLHQSRGTVSKGKV